MYGFPPSRRCQRAACEMKVSGPSSIAPVIAPKPCKGEGHNWFNRWPLQEIRLLVFPPSRRCQRLRDDGVRPEQHRSGHRTKALQGGGTEKMLRPWSQQARQLTPRGGTFAHLGNQGCCVHIHTGNLSLPRSCTTHAYSGSIHKLLGSNLTRVDLPPLYWTGF